VSRDVVEFQKHDQDKPRPELIPAEAIHGMAVVFAYGARKYSAHNWCADGVTYGRYYGALLRHLNSWWSGETWDAETGESHLDHALCCLAILKALQSRNLGVDDRPDTTSHYPAEAEDTACEDAAA